MTPIPEDVQRKIDEEYPGRWWNKEAIAAEYGYSLAQEEIERLKELIPPITKEESQDELLASNEKPEYIICAAIHFNDNKEHPHQPRNIKEGFVICGRRHHNCYTIAALLNGDSIIGYMNEVNGKAVQGFLTSKDKFVDRKEAGKIAFSQKQINKETNCLFSEDLY